MATPAPRRLSEVWWEDYRSSVGAGVPGGAARASGGSSGRRTARPIVLESPRGIITGRGRPSQVKRRRDSRNGRSSDESGVDGVGGRRNGGSEAGTGRRSGPRSLDLSGQNSGAVEPRSAVPPLFLLAAEAACDRANVRRLQRQLGALDSAQRAGLMAADRGTARASDATRPADGSTAAESDQGDLASMVSLDFVPELVRLFRRTNCFSPIDAWLRFVHPGTTKLDLSGTNVSLTGAPPALRALARSAIVALDLSYSTGVTDKSIRNVCKHLPNLQSLRIVGCNRVTDAGIALLKQHKNLRLLDVRIDLVSAEALRPLSQLPRLEVIMVPRRLRPRLAEAAQLATSVAGDGPQAVSQALRKLDVKSLRDLVVRLGERPSGLKPQLVEIASGAVFRRRADARLHSMLCADDIEFSSLVDGVVRAASAGAPPIVQVPLSRRAVVGPFGARYGHPSTPPASSVNRLQVGSAGAEQTTVDDAMEPPAADSISDLLVSPVGNAPAAVRGSARSTAQRSTPQADGGPGKRGAPDTGGDPAAGGNSTDGSAGRHQARPTGDMAERDISRASAAELVRLSRHRAAYPAGNALAKAKAAAQVGVGAPLGPGLEDPAEAEQRHRVHHPFSLSAGRVRAGGPQAQAASPGTSRGRVAGMGSWRSPPPPSPADHRGPAPPSAGKGGGTSKASPSVMSALQPGQWRSAPHRSAVVSAVPRVRLAAARNGQAAWAPARVATKRRREADTITPGGASSHVLRRIKRLHLELKGAARVSGDDQDEHEASVSEDARGGQGGDSEASGFVSLLRTRYNILLAQLPALRREIESSQPAAKAVVSPNSEAARRRRAAEREGYADLFDIYTRTKRQLKELGAM